MSSWTFLSEIVGRRISNYGLKPVGRGRNIFFRICSWVHILQFSMKAELYEKTCVRVFVDFPVYRI